METIALLVNHFSFCRGCTNGQILSCLSWGGIMGPRRPLVMLAPLTMPVLLCSTLLVITTPFLGLIQIKELKNFRSQFVLRKGKHWLEYLVNWWLIRGCVRNWLCFHLSLGAGEAWNILDIWGPLEIKAIFLAGMFVRHSESLTGLIKKEDLLCSEATLWRFEEMVILSDLWHAS